MLLLSRFPGVRTVGSRRSYKKSRSTQRGLRVDTDLVEFRQLQEVGIFPTWFILWLRAILWMGICRGLDGCVFGLKIFEPSGGNPYSVIVNSADPWVSLFT